MTTRRRGTHKGEVPEVDMHLASHLLRQRSRDYANVVPTPSGCGESREMEGTERAQAPTMLWMYKAGRDKIR